jgi:hypothetical protein
MSTSQQHVHHRCRSRRIKKFSGPGSVRVHSAHIGQEVEVHYRWHPLYGQQVKVRDIEQRGGSQVVHIEAAAGVVKMIAGWMLDAAICSAIELGEPRGTVATLSELHRLLADRHLRANSPDDSNIVREKRSGQTVKGHSSATVFARGNATPDVHEVRHRRASGDERSSARKKQSAILRAC